MITCIQVLTIDRGVLYNVHWSEAITALTTFFYLYCTLSVSLCWAEMVRKVSAKNLVSQRGICRENFEEFGFATLAALIMVRCQLNLQGMIDCNQSHACFVYEQYAFR